jgi:hypothetical protein
MSAAHQGPLKVPQEGEENSPVHPLGCAKSSAQHSLHARAQKLARMQQGISYGRCGATVVTAHLHRLPHTAAMHMLMLARTAAKRCDSACYSYHCHTTTWYNPLVPWTSLDMSATSLQCQWAFGKMPCLKWSRCTRICSRPLQHMPRHLLIPAAHIPALSSSRHAQSAPPYCIPRAFLPHIRCSGTQQQSSHIARAMLRAQQRQPQPCAASWGQGLRCCHQRHHCQSPRRQAPLRSGLQEPRMPQPPARWPAARCALPCCCSGTPAPWACACSSGRQG